MLHAPQQVLRGGSLRYRSEQIACRRDGRISRQAGERSQQKQIASRTAKLKFLVENITGFLAAKQR
jgi:hypothetical protein